MKYLWSLMLLLVLAQNWCFCQNSNVKHDRNSIFGYMGNAILTVDDDSTSIVKLPMKLNFSLSSSTVSDEQGNLQYYTNGIKILNKNHVVMTNGDRINPGKFLDELNFTNYGVPLYQGVLSLPMPAHPNIYYTFNTDVTAKKYNSGLGWICAPEFYYQKIDMTKANGLGEVVEPNQLITNDTLEFGSLVACKHANGRDWWLLVNKIRSSIYKTYQLSPTGLEYSFSQNVDSANILDKNYARVCLFTPDGTKFIKAFDSKIPCFFIIDFDRCTGRLGHSRKINVYNNSLTIGAATSSDSRFLYISKLDYVLQYDLQAEDIEASVDTVAINDGFVSQMNGNRVDFFQCWLGPDGRIYLNSNASTEYLHVIEKPNEKGVACVVKQHEINLKVVNVQTTPNFPNYRLGPLKGSPCDTLSVATKELSLSDYGLKLFPNPASDRIQIDITLPHYDPATKTEVVIVDVSGVIVQKYTMPDFAFLATLDISKLASGVYAVQLRQRDRVLGVEKLVVMR